MRDETGSFSKLPRLASAVLFVWLCAPLLVQAAAPLNRTYYTVFVGLYGGNNHSYQVDADCLYFTEDQVCLEFDRSCGTWESTSSATGLRSIVLEIFLDYCPPPGDCDVIVGSGTVFTAKGHLEVTARREAIGGTGMMRTYAVVPGTPLVAERNVAFGGRATSQGKCHMLVRNFYGVTPASP